MLRIISTILTLLERTRNSAVSDCKDAGKQWKKSEVRELHFSQIKPFPLRTVSTLRAKLTCVTI